MTQEAVEFLLAEDNEDDIILIQECFSEARISNKLNVVRDGQEALAYLRHTGKYASAVPPGLVILDLNMPKKSGLEVLRDMKADPKLRYVPAVILTTSEREVDIVRSYNEGAATFIAKPARFEDFRDVIKQFALYWLVTARLPPIQVKG